MNIEILILIASIINFLLTITIILKSEGRYNRYFALATLSVALWGLSTIMLNRYVNMFWERLVFLAALSGVFFITHFSTQYTNKRRIILQNVSLALFSFLFTTVSLTSFVVTDILKDQYTTGIKVVLGPGIYFFSLFVFVQLFQLLINLIQGYRESKYSKKEQLRYLMLGITLFVIPTLVTNLILPIFNIFILNNLGVIFSLFLTSLVTYSIIRHRLFGIRFVIGRTIYIIVIALIPYIVFHGIYFIQTNFWGDIFATGALLTGYVYAVIFVYILLLANTKLNKFINEKIINPGYNPEEAKDKFIRSISSELNLDKVVSKTLELMHKTINPKSSSIIIFNLANKNILFQKKINFEFREDTNEILDVIHFWDELKQNEPLIREELLLFENNYPRKSIKRLKNILHFMNKNNIAAIFPLNRKVQLNGLLILGEKKNESIYTVHDIEFIESIVANASVAIGRALLYQQVSNFAQELEKKVDSATEELEQKNEALQQAAQRERDMMDIVGHELRTPATLIKNALANIKLLKRMKKLSEEKMNNYITKAQEATEREIKLINVFLGATKLEGGFMQLDPSRFSIVELAKQVVKENKSSAENKKIKLIFRHHKETIPMVNADRTRIGEVIDNLISNAIKFTRKGKIEVWCDADDKKENVTVLVKDTGIGIAKEDQKHLFKKFGRLQKYISEKERMAQIVRPGGTGLGLFLVKGIVTLHGGKVGMKSTFDKGSTFWFTLPVQHKISPEHLINPIFKTSNEKDVFRKLGLKRSRKKDKKRK